MTRITDGISDVNRRVRESAAAQPGGGRASVAIIDDQRAFAEALGLAISLTDDLEVVGRAPDAASGRELVLATNPDLAVCDYRLPGAESGVDCLSRLRDEGYTGAAVILTGYPAPQVHREAADVPGAAIQVLSKDSEIQHIISAFRRAVAGDAETGAMTAANGDNAGLSAGELEVLEMINSGMTAVDIAGELFLSVHSIRSRIKSALRKLGASSQIEAVATATRRGILVPPG